MTAPPGTTQADAIYDLLVSKVGAHPRHRTEFVESLMEGCREFRFQGKLGFGGKIYVDPHRIRIGCYRDDGTPERLAIILEVNAELEKLNVE